MADLHRRPLGRTALLLPGGLALLLGLDAGLLLLGLPAPLRWSRLPDVHGVLMVLGFVGTVVALERAVALRRTWGYLAPAGFGAGALLLVSAAPAPIGSSVLVLGAATLIAVYVPLWRRQPAGAVVVQAGGAVLALGAAVLSLGGVPMPIMLPWLAGFLILTISGERLELARVALLAPHAEMLAVGASALVAVGVLAAMLWPVAGYPLLGVGMLVLTAWLTRYDVARRTVTSTGLPRFMAVCLLTGYAWLAVAGGIWLAVGAAVAGPWYDAAVHVVFLGYVMSMVMAHAPVILPAVLRRPLPYRPVMYVPVLLLHTSLILRVAVGDGRGVTWAWLAGGVLNILAVVAFVAVAGWSAATARSVSPPAGRVTQPVTVDPL